MNVFCDRRCKEIGSGIFGTRNGRTQVLPYRAPGQMGSSVCIHLPVRKLFTSVARKAGLHTPTVQTRPQVACARRFRTQKCTILLITVEQREPRCSCSCDCEQIVNLTHSDAFVSHSHIESKPKRQWSFRHGEEFEWMNSATGND